MSETLRGRLLVAAPILPTRTSIGPWCSSRSTATRARWARPQSADGHCRRRRAAGLAPLAGEEDPVYVGGPVALESVLAVAELDDPDDTSELLFGTVGFVQDTDVPVLRGRVYVGYAGWSAGQLEAELEEESWLVLPAEPDDVFSDDPDGLWSAVLRRQGGPYALLSLMPPDPSLN
jgi:putative transcriptional regulator